MERARATGCVRGGGGGQGQHALCMEVDGARATSSMHGGGGG